jgi:hypothetical protein
MSEFDLAQREQTRQALLEYMKRHEIGVPRLAKRIRESVSRHPEIPIKTLQRFLKGEIRTNDIYVGFFGQFVEKTVTGPTATAAVQVDPTARVSEALKGFYPTASDDPPMTGPIVVYSGKDNGTSEVTISQKNGCWRVMEVGRSPKMHVVYDGTLVRIGGAGLFVLRDRLTGLPRIFATQRASQDEFSGHGMHFFAARPDIGDFSVLPIDIKMRG